MTLEAWITLSILIVMFVLLIKTKLPAWIIFLGALTTAITLRLAPEEELLKGFSNSGVLTVGALFMVAAGMYSTGAISLIADKLIGFPRSLTQAQLRILPPIAIGSAFLNNTPLVAMMIPVIRDLGRTARLAVSKLYIPLSFASILGGASTLIGTSSNLIIAGLIADEVATGNPGAPGMRELEMFDPSWVGIPAAILGLIFIIIAGKWLLPGAKDETDESAEKRLYAAEFVVEAGSLLEGKTLEEAGFIDAVGYVLFSIRQADKPELDEQADQAAMTVRQWLQTTLAEETPSEPAVVKKLRHAMRPGTAETPEVVQKLQEIFRQKTEPPPEDVPETEESYLLQGGDILTFATDADSLPTLWSTIGLVPHIAPIEMDVKRHTHRLVEVVVSPQNPAVGHKVSELPIPKPPPYQASLVAISRNNEPPNPPLREMRIEAGDNAILEVRSSFFYEMRNETEFALIRRLHGYRVQRTERAIIAMVIILAMVTAATFGWMSMLNAALLATLALLLTGCLSLRTAGKSVEIGTLVVLASAVGLSAAVSSSGLSAALADLLAAVGGDNPYVALSAVFIGAAILANTTTSVAAAAVMFPIAVSLAGQLNINFMPFAITLMMGVSAFISPTSYQTNLMVYKPGGYKFADYVKIGLPLTLLVGVVTVILAPLVFGF